MKTETRTKSLMLRLTPDEHAAIKQEAAKRRISMRKLLLQSLLYYASKTYVS